MTIIQTRSIICAHYASPASNGAYKAVSNKHDIEIYFNEDNTSHYDFQGDENSGLALFLRNETSIEAYLPALLHVYAIKTSWRVNNKNCHYKSLESPLAICAILGKISHIPILLSHYRQHPKLSTYCERAIILAAQYGQLQSISVLLESPLGVRALVNAGSSALKAIVQLNKHPHQFQIIKRLLQYPETAQSIANDKFGCAALCEATATNQLDVAWLLLALPQVRSNITIKGNTALDAAIINRHHTMTILLLMHQEVSSKLSDPKTATLEYAVICECMRVIEEALTSPDVMQRINDRENYLLRLAITYGSFTVAKRLLYIPAVSREGLCQIVHQEKMVGTSTAVEEFVDGFIQTTLGEIKSLTIETIPIEKAELLIGILNYMIEMNVYLTDLPILLSSTQVQALAWPLFEKAVAVGNTYAELHLLSIEAIWEKAKACHFGEAFAPDITQLKVKAYQHASLSKEQRRFLSGLSELYLSSIMQAGGFDAVYKKLKKYCSFNCEETKAFKRLVVIFWMAASDENFPDVDRRIDYFFHKITTITCLSQGYHHLFHSQPHHPRMVTLNEEIRNKIFFSCIFDFYEEKIERLTIRRRRDVCVAIIKYQRNGEVFEPLSVLDLSEIDKTAIWDLIVERFPHLQLKLFIAEIDGRLNTKDIFLNWVLPHEQVKQSIIFSVHPDSIIDDFEQHLKNKLQEYHRFHPKSDGFFRPNISFFSIIKGVIGFLKEQRQIDIRLKELVRHPPIDHWFNSFIWDRGYELALLLNLKFSPISINELLTSLERKLRSMPTMSEFLGYVRG